MKHSPGPAIPPQRVPRRRRKASVSSGGGLRPLHTAADYEAALAEYEGYFDQEPQPETEQAYRFELLGILLARYEEEHYTLAHQDPYEALTRVMETKGKSQSDLAALIGASRASEILGRKRSLSVDHIRKIRAEWGVPADMLI